VLSNILQDVDRDDLAALVLLDLSTAFSIVDHTILLRRLRLTFGIDHTAHRWFESYLSFRKQYVRRRPNKSSRCATGIGLRTNLVILFVLYTADLLSVIESHGLSPHMYLRRSSNFLDEVQQASAESRQDRSSVVCDN